MSERLRGRRALITGAGRGIGRAIALCFAAEGASVALAARRKQEIVAVASEIQEQGGCAVPIVADVTSDSSITRLAEVVRTHLGQPDVVVSNAGAYAFGRFTTSDMTTFQHMIEVNYFGAVRVIKAFLPGMLEARRGSIVVVASTAGRQGAAYQTAYNASKHAVVGLVRSLALETAELGVRVNAIAPGFVWTEMSESASRSLSEEFKISVEAAEEVIRRRVPMRRFLRPEEIAPMAVYLASEESSGVTGQVMTIDGGLIVA